MERNGIGKFPKVAGDRVLELDVEELLNGVDLEGARRAPQRSGGTGRHSGILQLLAQGRALRAELDTPSSFCSARASSIWHDRRIPPGEEWERQIDEELDRADIILLLVSSDFVASDYCYDIEVKRAMARHHAGEARVIPVVVRDVDWRCTPFASCQPLPKEGRPVAKGGAGAGMPELAWRSVAEGIEAVAKQLKQAKLLR